MSAKLTPILGSPEPNLDLIVLLEGLLNEAKCGELQSLVAASEYIDRNVGNSYVVREEANSFQLIGALTVSINTLIKAHNLVEKLIV